MTGVGQQALLDIADQIERDGHYQGDGRAGGCCVVSNEVVNRWPGVDLLSRYLFDESAPESYRKVIRWNDRTDAEEVVETLRKVASL